MPLVIDVPNSGRWWLVVVEHTVFFFSPHGAPRFVFENYVRKFSENLLRVVVSVCE